ncbi:Acetyl esterase/lipase [Spirosomataceae bacterium TFI 002]|nr:Acetyl esterase/lipase [Spirosomataceae bacterium TFI 002]
MRKLEKWVIKTVKLFFQRKYYFMKIIISHFPMTITKLLLLVLVTITSYAQEKILYKNIETTELYLHHYPSKVDNSPAMVFFFGGGWNSGSVKQFETHAKYFSQRGISCFLVEYRVKNIHGTSPFVSLEDANSAMRYIRKNAISLNIDANKLIGAGGSAGGHLAAATAFTSHFNDGNDDMSISPVPNALALFNPVIDNGPAGYGYERIGESYIHFSPMHNIRKGAPPTILFLGDEDALIPTETAEYFAKSMERVGSKCKLKIYPKAKHGFFNYSNFEWYKDTILETDQFLQSIGFLSTEPKINIE